MIPCRSAGARSSVVSSKSWRACMEGGNRGSEVPSIHLRSAGTEPLVRAQTRTLADEDTERELKALEVERLACIEMTKAAFAKRRALIKQAMEKREQTTPNKNLRLPRTPPSLSPSAARRGAAKRSARQNCEATTRAASEGDEESARYELGREREESAAPAGTAPAIPVREELSGQGKASPEARRDVGESPSPKEEGDGQEGDERRRIHTFPRLPPRLPLPLPPPPSPSSWPSSPLPPRRRTGGHFCLADDTQVLWVTPRVGSPRSSPRPHSSRRPRTAPLRKSFSFSGPVTDAAVTRGGERKGRGFERSSSWHDFDVPPSRLLFGSERAEEGRFSLAKPTR